MQYFKAQNVNVQSAYGACYHLPWSQIPFEQFMLPHFQVFHTR
jgi:hypothetical protein